MQIMCRCVNGLHQGSVTLKHHHETFLTSKMKRTLYLFYFMFLFANFSPRIKQTGEPVSSTMKTNESTLIALNVEISTVGLPGVEKF